MRAAFLIVFCLLLAGTVRTALPAETMKQREQRLMVEKLLELKLAEVNRKLASIDAGERDVPEETRKKFTRLTEELVLKQDLANRKLEEIRSVSGQDWDRLKAEANSAIEDLNRVFEKIRTLLKGV
jgi:hypothetical protein